MLTRPTTLRFFEPGGRPINSKQVIIQVARSEMLMRDEMSGLLFILLLGLPIGVVTAGIFGYTLARRALAPVERMAERAQSITADRLHDRLPIGNPTNELGRLASVFNETLGRLEASFDQMRRFTADVSHELRTPLTAIRSVGEVGLRERRDEQGLSRDHRQHARGSRSARVARRPAAAVVAGGNRPDEAGAGSDRPARTG